MFFDGAEVVGEVVFCEGGVDVVGGEEAFVGPGCVTAGELHAVEVLRDGGL